jgi:signal transduction histidine kinase
MKDNLATELVPHHQAGLAPSSAVGDEVGGRLAEVDAGGEMVAEGAVGEAGARRMEELGRIILAYSEITERLQSSHELLRRQMELLREELSEKNRQLERRNRLAALGEMAAGMAHEIRNPLGAIQLYAGMLGSEVSGQATATDFVRKISAGVRRMEGVVGQVLDFARELRPQRQKVDLLGLLGEQAELARTASTATIEVAGQIGMEWWVDPLMLGQAVLNLITNAADAGGPCGHVRVECGRDATGCAVLSVSDTGPGVPEELRERIFDPFFTTKGRGTGLGLAIVQRVIEAHGGGITVGKVASGGAVFEMTLPWVTEEAAVEDGAGLMDSRFGAAARPATSGRK